MLYDSLIALLGSPPEGFEPIAYLCCFFILLWLLYSVFAILNALLKWIGGR